MKQHLLSALALALATAGPAACATGYYGGDYSYYDGYYDDYYGPITYGYWGPGDSFYYSRVVGGPFMRDEARHFRRAQFEGAHRFHMRGRPPAEHRHG